MKRIITLFIVFCLIFEQAGFSQVVEPLVLPSAMTSFAAADKFRPLHLRSVSLEAGMDNFHIILDKGDLKDPTNEYVKDSTRSLLQYFFVGLSLPNESFWVNLRPDAPDNIIDDSLARTDMGRIMLEADVQLKKDTAKYTSPNSAEGRQYWNKLYQKAEELFGDRDLSIPTMTRPWIVPNEIILRQTDNNAYIYKATLKVMLEADYIKDAAGAAFADERFKTLNDYSSQLIREMVLPKLTKDVNTSKRYAGLRQVYYSLILAQWFKNKYKNDMVWKIDSNDLTNLVSEAKWDKDTYFKEYRRSFQEGEYNIQENAQTQYGLTIRQYFSGGIKLGAEGPISSEDMTAVWGNSNINISSENTLAAEVNIGPGNQYNIENVGTGASRSGDHLSVKASPPGALVSFVNDGGQANNEDQALQGTELLAEMLKAGLREEDAKAVIAQIGASSIDQDALKVISDRKDDVRSFLDTMAAFEKLFKKEAVVSFFREYPEHYVSAVDLFNMDRGKFSDNVRALKEFIGDQVVDDYFERYPGWFAKNLEGILRNIGQVRKKFGLIIKGIEFNEEAGKLIVEIQKKLDKLEPVDKDYTDFLSAVRAMTEIYAEGADSKKEILSKFESLAQRALIAINRYNESISKNLSLRVIQQNGKQARESLIGVHAYKNFRTLDEISSLAGFYRYIHNKLMTDFIVHNAPDFDAHRTPYFRFMPNPDIYNLSGNKKLPEGQSVIRHALHKARYVDEQVDSDEAIYRARATFVAGEDDMVLISMPLAAHRFDCVFRASRNRPESNFIKLTWQDGEHPEFLSPIASKTRLMFVAKVLNRMGLTEKIDGWTLSAYYYVQGDDPVAAERSVDLINGWLDQIGKLNRIAYHLDKKIDTLFFGDSVYMNSQPLKGEVTRFFSQEAIAEFEAQIKIKQKLLREPDERLITDIIDNLTEKFFEGKYLIGKKSTGDIFPELAARQGGNIFDILIGPGKLTKPFWQKNYVIPDEYFGRITWYERARITLEAEIKQDKSKNGQVLPLDLQKKVWKELDMDEIFQDDPTLWAQLSEVWVSGRMKGLLEKWLETGEIPGSLDQKENELLRTLIFPPEEIIHGSSVRKDGGDVSVPGGIDLRRLPISVDRGQISGASGRNAMEKSPELDDQWQKIQDLVSRKLLPETAMIKEYLQACRQSNKVPARTDRVVSCIADIFRLEEDCCQATEPALKELVVLLEKN